MSSQLNLDLPPSTTMTINDVAVALQVSSASVRNWIKTGYLEAENGRYISRSSYEHFKKSVVGTEKLTKRANKSNVDGHNHDSVQAEFLARTSQWEGNDLDNAGSFYENALSSSHRNKEGIYYTPTNIVERFFNFIENDVSNLIFCDPCCGSGNFIIGALERGFLPENIYGFDTDPVAVEISKARLRSKAGIEHPNIYVADFLHDIVLKNVTIAPLFDVVFTNPPWGKKIESAKKIELSIAFDCLKSTDTAALFFRAALQKSASNAIIGMLLPESFFNISIFCSTREIAAKQKILGFVDFGKPFKGLLTKAKGIVVQKKDELDYGDEKILCETLSGTHFRSHNSFDTNPKHIFNFECNESNSDIINHLYSKPYLTLKGHARWGLGIVTGNNKKFVKAYPEDDHVPVFKGSEIQSENLPTPQNFIPSDLSLYQQVASRDLYFASEKLIYRFISSKLVFHHDTESKLFLNSANMLVLNSNFGITHENLAWLLNTRLMTWMFSNIFDTHKVLRSDLEALPIFTDFFDGSPIITEENLLEYLDMKVDIDGTYRLKK